MFVWTLKDVVAVLYLSVIFIIYCIIQIDNYKNKRKNK